MPAMLPSRGNKHVSESNFDSCRGQGADKEQIEKFVLGKRLSTCERQRDAHAISVSHVPAMWLTFARWLERVASPG